VPEATSSSTDVQRSAPRVKKTNPQLVHPLVQREPPDRTAEALLEKHGEDPVGGEALHVEPHGLLYGVLGEPGPRARDPTWRSEGPAAAAAQEPLEGPQGTGQPGGGGGGPAVPLGVEAPALRAADAPFVLLPGLPIHRLLDSYHENRP
jgi:hypothetical protein